MVDPVVSVILPVFNPGPSLESCFERLTSAVPARSQIIVVDDGSTDGTLAAIRRFAARDDRVVTLELGVNRGVAAARNEALRHATGEYVWFVDWDDEWSPSIVAVLVREARSTAADVAVCRATWRRPDGIDIAWADGVPDAGVVDGPTAFDLVLQGQLKGYLWSKLFRRDLIPPDVFPPLRSQSDFCGVVPLLARVERVVLVPDVLYHHVIRDGSITNSRNPRIDNLTRCREVVRGVAAGLPSSRRRERLLLRYDYESWHLARINTAVRLSASAVARAEVRAVVRVMRLREIGTVALVAPRLAVKAFLTKMLGPAYVSVRPVLVAVRDRARDIRLREVRRRRGGAVASGARGPGGGAGS